MLEPVLDLFRGPRRLVAILAVLALVATFCLALIPNVPTPRFLETWPTPESGWEPWRPLFKGIDIRRASFSVPRPMKAHAVRIDLLEPGIEPVVHAGTPAGSPTVPTIYPSDFLKDNQLQVAFSAGSFNPFPYWKGVPVRLDGLGIANGLQFSSQALNLDSLLILRSRRGVLYHHTQPVTQHREAIAGVGGMWINLLGGTNQHEPLPPEASSVAGLSDQGRYLYWLIVDGRQPGYSEGATPGETAEMMRQVGVEDALNMDGGSVVTLVVDDGHGGYDLLNQPCHPFITGVQRPIGGLIGFRARPLK